MMKKLLHEVIVGGMIWRKPYCMKLLLLAW